MYVRNWRTLDVDAFVSDLQTSDLVVSPPDDVVASFECYNTTLRTLLDRYAPLELKEVKCRSSARWFDSDVMQLSELMVNWRGNIVDSAPPRH